MKKVGHDIAFCAVQLLDPILLTAPVALCWFGYYAGRIYDPFYYKGNWLVVTLCFCLLLHFCKEFDALSLDLAQPPQLISNQIAAVLPVDAIMFCILLLLTRRFPNILPAFTAFFGQVACAAAWAYLAHMWYCSTVPAKPCAAICGTHPHLERMIHEYGLDQTFDIQISASVEECLNDTRILDSIEAVFLDGVHSHDRNTLLKYCIKQGITVYTIPGIGDTLMSGARQVHMLHLPVLQVTRYAPSPAYLLAKRLIDVVFSVAMLIALSWLMIGTAIAIKINDGGPVLYKQVRLTQNGKPFTILKFRSMRVDAEQDGAAQLSTGDTDSRATRVGRFIRKYRIDELPQLFCVLHGTMSLVGPRPERPEFASQYTENLPEFALRLQAKAGLTGYAQVYGKYTSTPYDKLQMDLMYIAHPSIREDLRIIFATLKALLTPENMENISSSPSSLPTEDSSRQNQV